MTITATGTRFTGPDGLGYYWAFVDNDNRQLNVRHEQDRVMRWNRWVAYVSDHRVGAYKTKDEAEDAAIAWATSNPPEKEQAA